MKKLIPMLLGSLIILNGCSKGESQEPNPETPNQEDPTNETPEEEEPKMVTYFTFEALLDTSESDDWIIIHDDEGNLLDFSPYEEGNLLTFDKLDNELSSTFTVTFFNYFVEPTGVLQHTIKSYPEISIGSTWKQTPEPLAVNEPIKGVQEGYFQIFVENAPAPKYRAISDKYGLSFYEHGWPYSEDIIENFCGIYRHNNLHYSFYDSNDELKYYTIQNVSHEDYLFVDYSEFKSYDSYVEIDIPFEYRQYPTYQFNVTAFESDEPFSRSGGIQILYVIFSQPLLLTNPLKFGYLDSYDRYKTELWFDLGAVVYNYRSFGAKPDEITIPKNATRTVIKNSIYQYEFETNVNHQMKHVSWSNWDSYDSPYKTNWNVYSGPEFYGKIGEIPQEIQQSYPNLGIQDMQHKGTSLYLDFITYPDLIQQEFVQPDQKTYYSSYEIFTLR
ncbi:hypothetical protein [Flagellimonas zhangzhouensis]|uniref:Uncharacterized protein n=1 Tax=Flagellimonas zhangzhouensis TaxID=1073328 RepID=A0A1H2UID2_9FLAO|nr:hypothetical protein [Allomuricauda zhangzhouensis]SDQ16712.1 hypothetical protein SAMN05216294_0682 [Allomuricauda zhangzhouensis]SDW55936.1 hypothetical protein SAMN04487892_1611 [Allomuricauda zhangzhouensis]